MESIRLSFTPKKSFSCPEIVIIKDSYIDFVRQNDIHSLDCTHQAEEQWVQEVIAHRGKTNRNRDCTPGYYNFEGADNRRQDGNYNGTMKQYLGHMSEIRENMADHFVCTHR